MGLNWATRFYILVQLCLLLHHSRGDAGVLPSSKGKSRWIANQMYCDAGVYDILRSARAEYLRLLCAVLFYLMVLRGISPKEELRMVRE